MAYRRDGVGWGGMGWDGVEDACFSLFHSFFEMCVIPKLKFYFLLD